MNLWVPSVIYPSGKCKIGLIAAHSWDNIPWEFPGRWNVLLARIDYLMHYHGFLSQLFLEETTKITFLVSRARLSGLRDYYFPVLFTVHWKYIVVIGWSSLLFKFTWGIGLFTTVFLAVVLLDHACSTRPSQRSKYTEGVVWRMRRCVVFQRLGRKCVQKKNTPDSVSIVSLWLYCHPFGVNSHSVAVIATGYPVAIATALYNSHLCSRVYRELWWPR